MFRQSGNSRAISADIGEIERRLRAIEHRLERAGGRASASAAQAADQVGESIAAAFGNIAERFRGSAASVSDEAVKIGGHAAKEAAKLGHGALRRISQEVEHRPLVTLAVAVGVGVLVGLASHRH
jgi:ElaB/YqjD/DUF883 family membrane-anchored ribosome-binding protein